jgi:chromosome segregation ATPase
MHLEIDERVDVWDVATTEPPAEVDEQRVALESHFAQVQSWHVELSATDQSLTTRPRAEGRRSLHEQELELVAARAELQNLENRLAARERELVSREEVFGCRDADRQQMLAQQQQQLEELQRGLYAERERLVQWSRELERQTASVAREQQQLDELRQRLENQQRQLEQQEARLLERAASSPRCREEKADEEARANSPLEAEIAGEPDAAVRDVTFDEARVSESECRFMDQQLDPLIDRLMRFHVAKTRKWYHFWR